jgi:UrcA family protein
MTTLLKAICVTAGVCAAALATAASAQTTPARIQVSDLNLNSAQGRAAFDARVERAARTMCESYEILSVHDACMRAVREEAADNLAWQREQYARQTGEDVVAAARR